MTFKVIKMDTITIELTNHKAFKLIKDMEELDLIRILEKAPDISLIRQLIKAPMSNEEIDKQLNVLRKEWQRNF